VVTWPAPGIVIVVVVSSRSPGMVRVTGTLTLFATPGTVTVVTSPAPGMVRVVGWQTEFDPCTVTVVTSPAPGMVRVVGWQTEFEPCTVTVVTSPAPGMVNVIGTLAVLDWPVIVTVVVILKEYVVSAEYLSIAYLSEEVFAVVHTLLLQSSC